MIIRNWRTTLGGALQSLGTTLMGISIVPSLTSMDSAEKLKYFVMAGFIIQAIGGFFQGLFAMDRVSVGQLVDTKIKEDKEP